MSSQPFDRDRAQSLTDVFRPNRYELDTRFVLRDGRTHPCALICPGGAYAAVCSYIEGTPIARRLNALGVSAFIVYYRVREKARFPNPQDDLARAVGEILSKPEQYAVDPESYSVWGFSAGGHLAASFGTTALGYPKYGLPKPAAMVLGYPVISMKEELTHRETRNNLLGKGAGQDMVRLASIEEQVTGDYPPTYLWCGDADSSVSPENTRLMASALEKNGVPCLCEIFPRVTHGAGPGTSTAAEGWIERAAAFWREQCQRQRAFEDQ